MTNAKRPTICEILREPAILTALWIAVCIIVALVAFVLLDGCAPPAQTRGWESVNQGLLRIVDEEAAVVCWAGRGGDTLFCLPCSETELDCDR